MTDHASTLSSFEKQTRSALVEMQNKHKMRHSPFGFICVFCPQDLHTAYIPTLTSGQELWEVTKRNSRKCKELK